MKEAAATPRASKMIQCVVGDPMTTTAFSGCDVTVGKRREAATEAARRAVFEIVRTRSLSWRTERIEVLVGQLQVVQVSGVPAMPFKVV